MIIKKTPTRPELKTFSINIIFQLNAGDSIADGIRTIMRPYKGGRVLTICECAKGMS